MPAIRRFQLSLVLCSALVSPHVVLAQETVAAKPVPPVAKKVRHETTHHGDTRVDDYFWLRDKTNPEVIAYLEAENAYTEAMMKGTEALQQKIYDEILGHMKETDFSLPDRIGDYYYYTREEQGKQYPIRARKKERLDAPEEVLLDLNELARDLKYIDLRHFTLSKDGNLLAYSTDTKGGNEYTLFIKDLRTGELLPEKFERVNSAVWANDNKTLFYGTDQEKTLRHEKVFRHVIGSSTSELVYQERDELYQVNVNRTADREFILLESYSKTATEVQAIPAGDPTAAARLIAPRRTGHTYVVEHRGDHFYIRTNDHAPNYRLVKVKDSNPSMENWKEVVPGRPNVELFEVNMFANHMALSEVENGNRTIRIVDLRTGASKPITFGEAAYNLSRDRNPDFRTTKFRYRYNSLLSPEAIYEFDMEKGFNTLLKRTEVPNYDASKFGAERIFATASDGTKIPISIVYRKPLVRDGKRPMLLYSYGSYGIPLWPFFSFYNLPLLDRGAVYAVVHVRGGGGMGPAWRDAGRMMQKRNTFTDFVAAGEHLVRQKYTSSDRLVATGRSAGGLLMGAAMNIRPGLFKAMTTASPFVDVLNTMLDPSLPQTTAEYLEWGNPNVAREYEYIKSYSPYDNIRRAAYPAMFVGVSLNDSRSASGKAQSS